MTAHQRLRLEAGVLVPIRSQPPHHVLFIRRAAHLRRHADQVAFPGGRREPADADLLAAALRETHEEIGLAPNHVRVVGALAQVRQRVGAFDIAPFVGIVSAGAPELRADPSEIATLYEIPLAAILAPDAVHPGIETVGDLRIETWHFDYGAIHVWGATGRILADLVASACDEASPVHLALAEAGMLPTR